MAQSNGPNLVQLQYARYLMGATALTMSVFLSIFLVAYEDSLWGLLGLLLNVLPFLGDGVQFAHEYLLRTRAGEARKTPGR